MHNIQVKYLKIPYYETENHICIDNGIVTTGIISFTLITVNLGWAHLHFAIWLKSWLIAYLIVIPAILIISPFVEKIVHLLISKKIK